MARFLIGIVTGLCLFTQDAQATRVVFRGKEPVDVAVLRRLARALPESRARDSTLRLLESEGYLDAAATIQDGRLLVEAGRLYTFSLTILGGDSGLSRDQLPFTRKNLDDAIGDVLADLYRKGYYYAAAEVLSLTRNDEGVAVRLKVNRGPLVRLKDRIYDGLVRTKRELVDRFLPDVAGDTLTESLARTTEKSAAAIPFLSFQPPVAVRPREGYTEADLEFRFSEKRQFRVGGGAGYVPGEQSGLVWSLNLGAENLFGTGRQASVISERREKGRDILDVKYRQPLFLLGVGSLGVNVATRNYWDQFYEFSLKTDWRANLSAGLSAGLELGWSSVEPSGSALSYNRFGAKFDVRRETIDDVYNPSTGVALRSAVAYSHRRYGPDSLAAQLDRSSYNETRMEVSLALYARLVGNLIGHLGLAYSGFETSEPLPPLSELVLIGGPPVLRGFRNEQFAVLRAACATIEPRWRFGAGYLFTFYDAAYLNNRVSDGKGGTRTDQFYRNGYGLGISLNSRVRAVKLSFGWSPEVGFDQPRVGLELMSDI